MITLGSAPLVCMDGSQAAMGSLRLAIELARAAGRKLRVVIVDEVGYSLGTCLSHGRHLGELLDKARALWEIRAKETERAAASLARSNWVDVEVEHRVGRVADEVVQAAEEATVVILGRAGSGAARNIGTSTSYVMRHCRKPVLLAPERFHHPEAVIAAYAAKALGSVVLRQAWELASLLRIPLEVLTVGKEGEEPSRVLDQARSELLEATAARFSMRHGRCVETLSAAARPDTILVMGAYGGSRLQRMVLGSITEQVALAARGPVMIARGELPEITGS